MRTGTIKLRKGKARIIDPLIKHGDCVIAFFKHRIPTISVEHSREVEREGELELETYYTHTPTRTNDPSCLYCEVTPGVGATITADKPCYRLVEWCIYSPKGVNAG